MCIVSLSVTMSPTHRSLLICCLFQAVWYPAVARTAERRTPCRICRAVVQTVCLLLCIHGCLGGIAVRALQYPASGHKFDSRLGHNQVTWVNSAQHPSGVGKSSTSLAGWGSGGVCLLVLSGK